ncbi:gamma-glutamyltransferase [Streptomyces sp. NPDC051954]|uniref:gamma-glutamyltransferase family protein n=1 Tax=Streptomyces sp. NPDC051954 TaxID=3155524 RepID=UPI0034242ED4
MSADSRLILAAPHPAALAAARRAAERGGNAVDAALAAAAALTVVYPHQCSLGGDLIALVHSPDGTVRAIVSAGAAAQNVDVGALRAADRRMPAQGPQTVTVPGVVAGWTALAESYGTQGTLAATLRDAAELAENDATVSPGLARAIRERATQIAADPGLTALLTDPDGDPLTEGAPLPQPRLAAVLRNLADDPWSFYRGAVAEALAEGLRRAGSPLTAADLAAHRPETVEPLVLDTADTRWWAAPPPSQGATLLAALDGTDELRRGTAPRKGRGELRGQPPPARSQRTARSAEHLITRCQDASAARDRLLGDPRRSQPNLDGLLHPAPLAGTQPPEPPSRPAGDTVAITAIDDSGLAISLIQSVYQTFGSGICDPSTGIVLHNRGSAFSLEPGHPARIGPGLRPPHTLCPVLGRSGDLLLAAGCQGGRAQPQILAQTVPALMDPDADPAEVLDRPRWVVGARDIGQQTQTLLAEPGSVPEELSPGIPVVVTPGRTDLAGHTQAVRLSADGRLDGAADPRADGGTVLYGAPTAPAPEGIPA